MDTVDGCCAPVAVLRTVWSGARSARSANSRATGYAKQAYVLGCRSTPPSRSIARTTTPRDTLTHAIDDAIERSPELAAKLAPRELRDGQHGIVLDEETRDRVCAALRDDGIR